jgi:hypothetical protein
MNRRRIIVYTSVTLIGVLIAAWGLLHTISLFWPRLPEAVAKSALGLTVNETSIIPQHVEKSYEVIIDVQATYPQVVEPGGSFRVDAVATVSKLVFYDIQHNPEGEELRTKRAELLKPTTADGPDEELPRRQTARRLFDRIFGEGYIELELNLAGVAVSPSGAVKLSENGVASWSVSTDKPGTYTGFVSLHTKMPPPTVGRMPVDLTLIAKPDERANIKFEARRPLFDRPTMMTWAATFFGSLLTLPGLWAVWQGYKKRQLDKQAEEAKKPKIILP